MQVSSCVTTDDLEEGQEHMTLARVAQQCELFAPYIAFCAVAICRDRRFRLTTYKKVFFGSELITWLCDEKLVNTRCVWGIASMCGCHLQRE